MTIEKTLNVCLTTAALVIAGVLVKREVFPRAAESATLAAATPPQLIENWQDISAAGSPFSEGKAPVTLVEFVDFECRACRRFHQTALASARQEFGDRLNIVFVHYPIEGHRFARPSARAAECARAQGQFEPFVDLVFAKQDSLGLKSWSSYAAEAKVPDLGAFDKCVVQTGPLPMVDSGVAIGKRLGVIGTPTVMLNGWLYSRVPSDSAVRHAVSVLLNGGQLSRSDK